MENECSWTHFDDKAKQIDERIKGEKRRAWEHITGFYPTVKYKNYGQLILACQRGKLSQEIVQAVLEKKSKVDALIDEAKNCREERDRLLTVVQQKFLSKRLLDPKTDAIPMGSFPKLRQCSAYPLRKNCNRGNTELVRWERCEYMQYDKNASISDPKRWQCVCPE